MGSRKSIPRSKSPKSGAPVDEQRSKHPLYFFANAFYTYSLPSNTPTVLCVVSNFIENNLFHLHCPFQTQVFHSSACLAIIVEGRRGGICPCRQCRRQCKIFASGVNFSIFTHFLCFFLLKLLKLGEIDSIKFVA